MPPWVDSRQAPLNNWTIEEKIAWVDKCYQEDEFVEDEADRLSEIWGGSLPSHGDYQRDLNRRSNGHQLSEREEAILRDSLEAAQQIRQEELLAELLRAHEVVDQEGIDPFDLDLRAEDHMLHESRRDNSSTNNYSSKATSSKTKRKGGQPSPSKPNTTGTVVRAPKKKK
ncbi:hypothetical protein EG329_002234 [Mollisiaceae sp. DMI_Dod_QoI]|nr:hypothetical protein EG329_002234 [Helotiales sp. DMI_Dod_QoI]